VWESDAQRTGIENVAGKVVPSADNQSLIPVTKAKYKNRSPIVLRPPKQMLKETTKAEFVPSPSHICNTDVSCWHLVSTQIYYHPDVYL
jgi:hypothetical protein